MFPSKFEKEIKAPKTLKTLKLQNKMNLVQVQTKNYKRRHSKIIFLPHTHIPPLQFHFTREEGEGYQGL